MSFVLTSKEKYERYLKQYYLLQRLKEKYKDRYVCSIDFRRAQVQAYPFLAGYFDYCPPQQETVMANSVATAVASKIADLGPSVEAQVVDTLVQREIDRRSEALVKIIDLHSKLEMDLKKIHPDQKSFDEAGKEVSSTFSKNKYEEKKKLTEKITKFENAINKALEKKDFSDVYNLANSGKSDGNKSDENKGDGGGTTE